MIDKTKRGKKKDAGFTLIELLVVITILGILAAIVVFAVGGIGDKGQDSACKTDLTTIQTAQEAYLARPNNNGLYADSTATLKTVGLLSTNGTLHTTAQAGTPLGSTYTIGAVAPCTNSYP